jgi:hypothetical protein
LKTTRYSRALPEKDLGLFEKVVYGSTNNLRGPAYYPRHSIGKLRRIPAKIGPHIARAVLEGTAEADAAQEGREALTHQK